VTTISTEYKEFQINRTAKRIKVQHTQISPVLQARAQSNCRREILDPVSLPVRLNQRDSHILTKFRIYDSDWNLWTKAILIKIAKKVTDTSGKDLRTFMVSRHNLSL
jgi:hypothetical protein